MCLNWFPELYDYSIFFQASSGKVLEGITSGSAGSNFIQKETSAVPPLYQKPSTIVSQELSCEQDSSEDLTKKRRRYPFDSADSDETYLSEYEEEDGPELTKKRRFRKDNIEKELRVADNIQNEDRDTVLEGYKKFLMEKYVPEKKSEGRYSDLHLPTTVSSYLRCIKGQIIPIFYKIYNPFKLSWLTDISTPKNCLVLGQQRRFVRNEEPIYFTSVVLKEVIKKIDSLNVQEAQLSEMKRFKLLFLLKNPYLFHSR